MARKIDQKAVKQRIKENKVIIKETKKAINSGMASMVKGEVMDKEDVAALRAALAMFIKACRATTTDAKLLD